MANYDLNSALVRASTNATKKNGVAGATIAAGQPLYLDPADNSYKLLDTNGASPLYKFAGMALNSAAAGQPVSVVSEDPNYTHGLTLSGGGAVPVGAIVIASATAGALAPVGDLASGYYTTVIGVTKTATTMVLKGVSAEVAVPE